jgi:hypothetical protein
VWYLLLRPSVSCLIELRCSTLVGSGLARSYKTKPEMVVTDKRSSLLVLRESGEVTTFYNIDTWKSFCLKSWKFQKFACFRLVLWTWEPNVITSRKDCSISGELGSTILKEKKFYQNILRLGHTGMGFSAIAALASISPTFYGQCLPQNPFGKKLQTYIVST